MTTKPSKKPETPFLYRRAEDAPRQRGPGATFQQETIKNEGQ